MGSPFYYRKYYNENQLECFEIMFSALAGMDAYFYSENAKWIFVD